jgi:hypothetical protein
MRPGTKPEADAETQTIIEQRLATFDEDVKTATDARAAVARLREKLAHSSHT